MKTIKKLLKQTDHLANNTQVTLRLHIPLKKVRAHAKRLASLGVSKVTIKGGSKATVKKAKASATQAVKKAITRKKPAAKGKPKASAKKPVTTKPAAKKTSTQRGRTTGVTQAAVLAALRAQHSTPQAIANAMKVNPVQVRKALSRYTQQGLIVRTQPGHYALKSS